MGRRSDASEFRLCKNSCGAAEDDGRDGRKGGKRGGRIRKEGEREIELLRRQRRIKRGQTKDAKQCEMYSYIEKKEGAREAGWKQGIRCRSKDM